MAEPMAAMKNMRALQQRMAGTNDQHSLLRIKMLERKPGHGFRQGPLFFRDGQQ
jgi:hypothetical protein